MKTRRVVYRSGCLRKVCDSPGKSTTANIRMEAKNGIYPSGSLQINRDLPEYATKVGNDMNAGM